MHPARTLEDCFDRREGVPEALFSAPKRLALSGERLLAEPGPDDSARRNLLLPDRPLPSARVRFSRACTWLRR